jgi:hypothetical protein
MIHINTNFSTNLIKRCSAMAPSHITSLGGRLISRPPSARIHKKTIVINLAQLNQRSHVVHTAAS